MAFQAGPSEPQGPEVGIPACAPGTVGSPEGWGESTDQRKTLMGQHRAGRLTVRMLS